MTGGQIEGSGNVTKVRIHPENHSWGWTIPTLFSQGWKVGNWIFVGGQVSADRNGQVVGVGDIEVQTRNVFENIRNVLREAGAHMGDIVKLNTFYVYKGSAGGRVSSSKPKRSPMRRIAEVTATSVIPQGVSRHANRSRVENREPIELKKGRR